MSKKQIVIYEGENNIRIGHEVTLNNHDTEQWISLMGYEVEVRKIGDDLSFTIHKIDEWNYAVKHEVLTIQTKETAQ